MAHRDSNVLDDARDIFVLEDLGMGSFSYVALLGKERIMDFYEQSREFSGNRHKEIQINENTGILEGFNFFTALNFDINVLRPRGLWTPGMFEMGVVMKESYSNHQLCREYGLGIAEGHCQNNQISVKLIKQAQALGFRPPLIIPLRDLAYQSDEISLKEHPTEIFDGEEAMRLSGITLSSGLYRLAGFNGTDVGWRILTDPFSTFDWACGKATKRELLEAYAKLVENKCDEVVELYRQRIELLV